VVAGPRASWSMTTFRLVCANATVFKAANRTRLKKNACLGTFRSQGAANEATLIVDKFRQYLHAISLLIPDRKQKRGGWPPLDPLESSEWHSLAVFSYARVALLSACSDLVGGLPFASLFSFPNCANALLPILSFFNIQTFGPSNLPTLFRPSPACSTPFFSFSYASIRTVVPICQILVL